MTFDAPVVLVLAPLLGGAVWFASAWARRVRVRRAAAWSESTARAARTAGRWNPTALSVSAFLGAVALAGPRWGEETIVAETRGLSLVVAMDISRSMLAEDATPSRLNRSVREARRLAQDLGGDRLGLIAFAGSSFILSPLSVDGSAIALYLDALDPEMVSAGGTGLAPALAQGRELLGAGSVEPGDRVLVVFTDGEAHDSLAEITLQAQRLGHDGIHLILVAEGNRTPVRIPVRDDRGVLRSWQQDDSGHVIQTWRRDDILGMVADAAQGTLVAAELPDQAGAVRDLVAAFKRSRSSESRTQRGRPHGWIPLLAGATLLFGVTLNRRTASLIGLLLAVGGAPGAAGGARAQATGPDSEAPGHRRTAAEKAWDRGDLSRARAGYLAELAAHRHADSAWFNAGTAALAAGDVENARAGLAHAAASLDPELRFRALFNLGLLELRVAGVDSTNRDTHLADAERAYREALLLKPHHQAAKWNLELAIRRHSGGGASNNTPPSGGGGAQGKPQQGAGGGGGREDQGVNGGGGQLSQSQAEEILQSIGEEELRTRRDKSGRVRRAVDPRVKDW